MGFVNNSLYTGDIDFQNIPSGQVSYWILPLTGITVQGNEVTLPTGSSSFAAIDTGTTLVGGPPSAIAALYAQIPGSAPASGNYDGYYTYPCDTSVTVSLSFGGNSWPISPDDFKMTESEGQCVGAFFQLTTGNSAPSWIIGDTFLVRSDAFIRRMQCLPSPSRKTCTLFSASTHHRWALPPCLM
jgi:cathepsin D